MDYKIILSKTKQMPRRKGNGVLGVRMNAELVNQIKSVCKDEDIFFSELIETFLIDFLSSYKKAKDPIVNSQVDRKKWP